MTPQTSALVRLGQKDFAEAFRVAPSWREVAKTVVTPFARLFARDVIKFERAMADEGVLSGARLLLSRFASSLSVVGSVPKDGPVILCSNHPGMMDAMAVWEASGRNDILTLAARRDLLDLLPATLKHLIIIDPANPRKAIRQAAEHLKKGGALLTFPAGRIEPDPMLREGAIDSLQSWSPSPQLIQRLVPNCRVVLSCVSGVINPAGLNYGLVRRIARTEDKEWAAATLQIIDPRIRKTKIRVEFGEVIGDSTACQAVMERLLLRATAEPAQL